MEEEEEEEMPWKRVGTTSMSATWLNFYGESSSWLDRTASSKGSLNLHALHYTCTQMERNNNNSKKVIK